MKKIVLFLSIAAGQLTAVNLLAQGTASHVEYYVYKHNGGASGFNDVKEGMNGNVYSLICNEPGSKKGVMSPAKDVIATPTGSLTISKDIEPYVIGQLSHKVYGGVYTFPGTHLEVSWKGSDASNYKMRILQK